MLSTGHRNTGDAIRSQPDPRSGKRLEDSRTRTQFEWEGRSARRPSGGCGEGGGSGSQAYRLPGVDPLPLGVAGVRNISSLSSQGRYCSPWLREEMEGLVFPDLTRLGCGRPPGWEPVGAEEADGPGSGASGSHHFCGELVDAFQ